MKRLIIILALFVALSASAQELKQGSVDCLVDQSKVGLSVNFSDAIIIGLQEKDYAQFERNWELCKQESYGVFAMHFNQQFKDIIFGHMDNIRYNCEAHVLNIAGNGRCTAELLVIDEQTKDTLAVISPIHSPGSSFGTTVRKIKVNMGYIGQNAGRALQKYIKKAKKKK